MSQHIIQKKLCAYLELISNSYTGTELAMTRQIIQSLSHGHCFGLSACFGLMHLVDKLDWWLAALKTIVDWDENSETLTQLIELPSALENKPISRKNLFERVLNYMIFTQASIETRQFREKGVNQRNIIGHLEILNEHGQIKKLLPHVSFSGYFTKKDLSTLLDTDDIKNSVCIIGQGTHSVAIIHKNNQWLLYNANYSHASTDTMCNVYDTKSDLIKKIIASLGHSLSIRMSTFKEHYLSFGFYYPSLIRKKYISTASYYYLLVKYGTKKLLKNHGLFMIVRNAPHQLPEILSALEEMPTGHDVLAQALSVSPGKNHVLTLIDQNAPLCLSPTIKLLSKSSLAPHIICDWLTENVLSTLDNRCPLLPTLFTIAAQSEQCPHYLARHMINHAIKNEQYSIVKPILENASPRLKEILMQDILEKIDTFPQMMSLLNTLPDNYDSSTKLATQAISYFINRLTSSK